MFPHVVEARHIQNHVLWVRFEDGAAGEIDLSDALRDPVFEPLLDVEFFKRFRIHEELKTLTWPNGADFAPEFLRERIGVPA